MTINIVTPVTRPQNIAKIRDSISLSWKECFWHLIFDKSTDTSIQKHLFDIRIRYSTSDKANQVGGHYHRNSFLDRMEEQYLEFAEDPDFTDEDWIYFLDDDNVLHPNFPELLKEIETNPDREMLLRSNDPMIYNKVRKGDIGVIIFSQALPDGSIRCQAREDNIRPRGIDTAQILFKISALKGVRFDPTDYDADGHFIKAIWEKNPESRIIIPEPYCYYNFLNGGRDQKPEHLKTK